MTKFYTINGFKIEVVKPIAKFDIRFAPQKELASYGEIRQQEVDRCQAIIDQRAA